MNKGKIIVAGIGPGSEADITPAVLAAIQSSDVIIGYKYYFRFITHLLREGTECIDTGMKREQARAEQAFAYANEGKTVCVISRIRASALSRKLRPCLALLSDMISV